MPIADWTVPFDLTSAVYSASLLPINQLTTFTSGTGIYLLRQDGCSLNATVRATKDNVPQADGSILHRRFLTGMEMNLVVQMWESTDYPACDALLQDMTDELMGYLYGLLNAGDNEGRISWTPVGQNVRMLDDIRLFTYPSEAFPGGVNELAFTIDCALPYAEDLTQTSVPLTGSDIVTNSGNRPTYPVWKIYGPFSSFTLTNTSSTPDEVITWDEAAPGAGSPVLAGDYIEIDTFRNSITKVVTSSPPDVLSNVAAGLGMTTSDFFLIPPGSHTITLSYTGGAGGSSVCLLNNAWA